MEKEKRKCYLNWVFNNVRIIALLLFFMIIMVLLSLFLIINGFTGFMLLYVYSRYNFYYCMILASFAFFIFYVMSGSNTQEALLAVTHKYAAWTFLNLRFLLLPFVAVSNLLLIILLLTASVMHDGSHYFIRYFAKDYSINLLLPQLVFLLAAAVAARVADKVYFCGLSLLATFFLLTSPLTELLVWREKPKGLPLDKVVNGVLNPFKFFYQNAEWSPDVQYGLQGETFRLVLLLLWIALLILLIVWHAGHTKLKLSAAVLTCCILTTADYPVSKYRINDSWDGYFQDLYNSMHDGRQASDTGDVDWVSKENYRITNYMLSVKAYSKLQVEGTLRVEADEPINKFKLTLDNCYHLRYLQAKNHELSVKVNGNVITCTLEKPAEVIDLSIGYAGFSSRFYANSQGVMLPGYYPWYPMAGEKEIFVQYHDAIGGYGYNPYNDDALANIEIHLNIPCEVVSNLQEATGREGILTGRSNGITLIGGKITASQDAIIKNSLPLSMNRIGGVYSEIAATDTRWLQDLDKLNRLFGLEVSSLKEKMVILASKDLARNVDNNYISEFSDHLLAAEGYFEGGLYLAGRVRKAGVTSSLARPFCSMLLRLYRLNSAEEVLDKLIALDSEYLQDRAALDGEAPQGFDMNALVVAREQVSANQVLKAITAYLLGTSTHHTDQELTEHFMSLDGRENVND